VAERPNRYIVKRFRQVFLWTNSIVAGLAVALFVVSFWMPFYVTSYALGSGVSLQLTSGRIQKAVATGAGRMQWGRWGKSWKSGDREIVLSMGRGMRFGGGTMSMTGLPPFVSWAVLAALCLWPVAALAMFVRRRLRRLPGHCQRCGYDLRASPSGVCPECGTAHSLPSPAPGPPPREANRICRKSRV